MSVVVGFMGLWLATALPAFADIAAERWSALSDTIFRIYGQDQGLPMPTAMAFAEDGDGFLWVGTQTGLARWDGYHFRVYRRDPGNPAALQDDFIWSLQRDDQGRLWVGTNSGGVARYDRGTDSFVTYSSGGPGQGPTPVRALASDGAGGMWVGSSRGLDHFGPQGEALGRLRHDEADPASLPADELRSLLLDRGGAMWIGTTAGLMRLDKGASAPTASPLGQAVAPMIRALFEDGEGRIWIGTDKQGVYMLSPKERKAIAVHDASSSGWNHHSVDGIVEGAPGEIWFSTDGEGLIAFTVATGQARQIRHDATRASSLPHDLLFSLYRDRSGLIWAGSYSGVGVTDPTQDAILTAFGGSTGAVGLTGIDIPAVLAARDGAVWVSYLAGGVDIIDPDGKRRRSLQTDPAHPASALPRERVRAMTQSARGDVYIGTYHGLYRASADGGHLTRVSLSPDRPDGVILSLASDESGLWIGTRGDGLWHLDYADGKVRRLDSDQLAAKWISAIQPAGDGRVWLGTFQGLYLLDPASGETRQALPDPALEQPHGDGLIAALLKDRRGRLWVGLLGGGLALSDGEDAGGLSRFRRFGTADGLPDTNVDTLVEDKAGRIWATNGGGSILSIDPDSLAIHTLRRADGVGVTGFAMNAGVMTAEGELLFGGDGGLTILRPERRKSWDYRPPVVVTDLHVGGRHRAVEPGSVLRVTPEANSLEVEFAALDYSAPDRNLYAYWLEGYDQGWVPVEARRRLASYTNLPPGRYTLHLRGSNREGVWSESVLAMPVLVLPAWYQTLPFKLTVALLAALGVWLLVRVRTSYLRRRQVVLERQVAERTAELRQSLIEVASSRAKVASLLDTSGQGFLSFGPDLIVESDYSRACESMLECVPAGQPVIGLLFPGGGARAALFREAVSSAMASADPVRRQLLLSLLPATIERRGCHLKSEYRTLENGHVMMVLTDVTEEHRLAGRVESERRRLEMIVAAVTDSREFFDAVDSYRQFFRSDLMRILSSGAPADAVYQDICRQIHTFKGTFSQMSFEATPKMLHQLEDALTALTRGEDMIGIGQIVERVVAADYHGMLENDLIVLRSAMGDDFVDQGKGVFLPMSQARRLRAIAESLSRGGPLDDEDGAARALLAEFRNLDKVNLGDALAVYDRVVSQLAQRLGKELTRLSIDGEDVWLDPERYGPFLRALVHVFRNAVTHGIESPVQRRLGGKSPIGRIDCLIRRQVEGDGFTLVISDDGAGIDVDALRARAVELDLISAETADALSDDQAMDLIFADTVSLRGDRADDLSGRGIGLAAMRAETEALGGSVSVTSSATQGARFEFTFPDPGAEEATAEPREIHAPL